MACVTYGASRLLTAARAELTARADALALEVSTTRAVRGLGIGLAITRQLVEAHQGSIAVASRPGEGTRSTVTIPAAAG